MSKLCIAVLTAVAFVYATWLVLSGRRPPEPERLVGWRRRFTLATLLFVGLLTNAFGNEKPLPAAEPMSTTTRSSAQSQTMVALQAIWRSLDPARTAEFRARLQEAVWHGIIRRSVADLLATAFSELSEYRRTTTSPAPTRDGDSEQKTAAQPESKDAKPLLGRFPTEMDPARTKARNAALREIEALANAITLGPTNEPLADETCARLARALELLRHTSLEPESRLAIDTCDLLERYDQGTLQPGAAAEKAARIIVQMGGARLSPEIATPFPEVRKQVIQLLTFGPPQNDWQDPDVHPSMRAVFEHVGFFDLYPYVTCYFRTVRPVQARSDELKELQRQLLDKNVRAGALNVQVAERSFFASTEVPPPQQPSRPKIEAHYRSVRDLIQLLYNHGELTSSFVDEIELTTAIEIIPLRPAEALRNDVRYFLRSAVGGKPGTRVIEALAQRKLIPPAVNHRLLFERRLRADRERLGRFRRKPAEDSAERDPVEESRLAEFVRLIDGNVAIEFPEDRNKKVSARIVPADDIEYRLKIRHVLRALIKTDLADPDHLNVLENLIAVPTLGKLALDR